MHAVCEIINRFWVHENDAQILINLQYNQKKRRPEIDFLNFLILQMSIDSANTLDP